MNWVYKYIGLHGEGVIGYYNRFDKCYVFHNTLNNQELSIKQEMIQTMAEITSILKSKHFITNG